MKVKSLYEATRGKLIIFGIVSFSFFPPEFLLFSPLFFSCKPWFVGWSVCLAGPVWNRALVAGQKSDKMLLSPFQWEASFAFGTLSVTGASVQFAAAIASLLGPYCCSWGVGLDDLQRSLPTPCGSVKLCRDPSHYEWYHLTLQVLDLCLSLVKIRVAALLSNTRHFSCPSSPKPCNC
uniref:Uncharacterized protein n=1 Tax=Calidris pygmaea TaxID=425635 RepID=A0A8C3JWJ0_9CHAR